LYIRVWGENTDQGDSLQIEYSEMNSILLIKM